MREPSNPPNSLEAPASLRKSLLKLTLGKQCNKKCPLEVVEIADISSFPRLGESTNSVKGECTNNMEICNNIRHSKSYEQDNYKSGHIKQRLMFCLSPKRQRRFSLGSIETLNKPHGSSAVRSSSEVLSTEDFLEDFAAKKSTRRGVQRRNSLSNVLAHKIKKAFKRANSKINDYSEESYLIQLLSTENVDWKAVQTYIDTKEGQLDFQSHLSVDHQENLKRNSTSANLMHVACQLDPPVEFLERILHHRPEWITQSNGKPQQSPLHLAAAWGASPAVVKFLIYKAPLLAAQVDHLQRTPLHLACECGWPHIQWKATQAGLEISDDEHGDFAVDEIQSLAERRACFEQTLDILFKVYPNATTLTNAYGFTPLQYVEWQSAGEWIIKNLTNQVILAKQQLLTAKLHLEQKNAEKYDLICDENDQKNTSCMMED